MTEKETHPNQAADLRREAENIARENADRSPEDLQAMSHEEIRHALHELRIHQIELEMQNSVLHRAQLELEESHARYFDLYDLAPVGYVTVSENGLMIEANLTAATMLGVARGVPGIAHPLFSQFIHIEDQDIYYLFRKQLFKTTGKPQASDLRMVKKDGPVFWAHLEATVVQDHGHSTGSLRLRTGEAGQTGEPVIRVIISDISAKQNLTEANNLPEQMVEERTKQLRRESKAPPAEGADTILFVDDDPIVLATLNYCLRNTGYEVLTADGGIQALEIMETNKIKVIVSDEQMEGMSGSELLAEVRRRFPHTLRILLSGHITPEMAMRAVNEGGIYRFLAKPFDYVQLRSTLFTAIEKYNSDSEKRRLVEELLKAEKSLQATLDGLASHIALLDANGAILFVNKPWREFAKQNSATSDSVYEGVNYLKVCDEATGERSGGAARFAAGIRAVLSGEMDQFICDYPCDAPGKARWFVGRVSSFEDEKPRRNVVVSHMDITDRKRAEKAVQEAHDLLEQRVEERTIQLQESLSQAEGLTIAADVANRAKSLFVGNMSHELRTPLSAVLGMTELLLNTPVSDQQRDYAEKIRKSGEALLNVISNILDFSEIEAGRMALESVPFSVEAIIRSVVKLFEPRAVEEKIEFHTTLDPEIPVLRGDRQRLTQVVSNLVGNAVKFTQAGEIRVAVKILRRTGEEIDLAIDVQDTGIGMTEEEISRLFMPFSQGDASTTRRFGGTGLGLSISRNLVDLMGGTLQVKSVFGKGSLFTVLVTFPIALGFVGSDLEFEGPVHKSVPINPPARKEGPPGDMAELRTLLERLRPALASKTPLPCKEILEVLLEKSWPEEQETLLAELSHLVRNYRLAEALNLLNKG